MKYKNKSISSQKSDQVASQAYKAQPDNIVFENSPSVTGSTFQDHLIILYGVPKIGKSKLFSHFPGVYFLPTEPGYKALHVRKTIIPNWATFRKFVSWAESHKDQLDDVKIWCIDTATNLSKFCMQWVCGRDGVVHPSDQDWGKGWEAFADEFAHWILRLTETNKGIGFIAHASTMEVTSRRLKITKEVPDLPKTTYRIINNLADIILNMSYVNSSKSVNELGIMRCLYTKPEETRDAGDRTGKLPDVIKFKTEKEAVRKILNCFEDDNTTNKPVKVFKKFKKVIRKKGGIL